ncbi:pleiotropic drug resistance protein 3-like [Gossypium australe]|uniref:Pleiotropic drug resistance protein 3-like n=1 Tax=Gossypium australe TaxID=47621 RepID=A0A5B6WYM5_9ROSI|nr:pleiotropic drug resistance protein 3-like [Gossypium australe]
MKYPPCSHCKTSTHLEKYYWFRPDIQCRAYKHFVRIERNVQALATEGNQTQEKLMFTTSCFVINSNIRNGCTNHMSSDESILKKIDRSYTSRVKTLMASLFRLRAKLMC